MPRISCERACVSLACVTPQFKLMTSWAVVCDVYFLPPARMEEDETAQQFAERVRFAALGASLTHLSMRLSSNAHAGPADTACGL